MYSLFPHNRFVRLLHSFSPSIRYALTATILLVCAVVWGAFHAYPKYLNIRQLEQKISAYAADNRQLKLSISSLQKWKKVYDATCGEFETICKKFKAKPPSVDAVITCAQDCGLKLSSITHEAAQDTTVGATTLYTLSLTGEYSNILAFLEHLPKACPFIPFTSYEIEKSDTHQLTITCGFLIVAFNNSFLERCIQL